MRPAVVLQYILPHRFLSRLVLYATRIRWKPWKNFLINHIAKTYKVNLDEAISSNVDDYVHFNAFFTRELKAGARKAEGGEKSIVIPADGKISQLGAIADGRIFQAKGQSFTAAELLADQEAAKAFANGQFATVYLSPRDYHRMHAPIAGRLLETVHVPGRLFSVAPFAVEAVPRLFARNERLVCHFETEIGPVAVIMVGAILVSGIETVWRGVEVPKYANKVIRRDYRTANPKIALDKFAEIGRFNMGSTVIVLLPSGKTQLNPALKAGDTVQLGQLLANW